MTKPLAWRNRLIHSPRAVAALFRLAPTSTTKLLSPLALAATLLVLLGTAAAHTARTRKLARRSAVYTVTATAYEAVAGQTDTKPFITADNSRIPRGYGSHTRWLALSRDLLRPWGGPFEFGDKVQVRGVSRRFDGVYTVHDTMNRRYRHRLDVLVHPRERISLHQPGVQLQRLAPALPRTAARKAPRKPAHRTKAMRPVRARRKATPPARPKNLTKATKRARARPGKQPTARHKSSVKKAPSKR